MKFDKRFFFDRQAVSDLVGKTTAKAMSKAGAFIQRRARSSLRRGGKRARVPGGRQPSPAGRPPRVWSTDNVATLKNIQFQFDASRLSVIVGPLLLNGNIEAVPGLHERGERLSIFQWRYNEAWFRTSRQNWRAARNKTDGNPWRTRSKLAANKAAAQLTHVETRQITASYPQRPYMGPALRAEAPKFPSLFARSA